MHSECFFRGDMKKLKLFFDYFTKFEKILWSVSVILIISTFIFLENNGLLTLIASIVGITALLFNAKGNPVGPLLMIVFSILYGIISFSFAYYGEMITYVGMSLPMAVLSLVTWLKNPYKGKKSQVTVNAVKKKEIVLLILFSIGVAILFYFILKYFNTANLILSTVSVLTSFIAAYLTFRRSPFFAFAYALNDVVLIAMWILASIKNLGYVSVIICFLIFLVNDLYTFSCWLKLQKKQNIGDRA